MDPCAPYHPSPPNLPLHVHVHIVHVHHLLLSTLKQIPTRLPLARLTSLMHSPLIQHKFEYIRNKNRNRNTNLLEIHHPHTLLDIFIKERITAQFSELTCRQPYKYKNCICITSPQIQIQSTSAWDGCTASSHFRSCGPFIRTLSPPKGFKTF